MDDFKCTENKGGDYGCQFIFPAEFQWHNFYQVIFESPLLRYVGNSLFVSVITLALQIVTGAMIAYAIVFMNFKGKKALFAVIMGTYMLPTAATYIPSYIILANWNLLNTFTGLIIPTVSAFSESFCFDRHSCRFQWD